MKTNPVTQPNQTGEMTDARQLYPAEVRAAMHGMRQMLAQGSTVTAKPSAPPTLPESCAKWPDVPEFVPVYPGGRNHPPNFASPAPVESPTTQRTSRAAWNVAKPSPTFAYSPDSEEMEYAPTGTSLRGDLAVYLDQEFGRQFQVRHINAIMKIIEWRYPDADKF